uniref:Uncharacterized protein n=1 Tax=Anopheles culicifacies TaxID=139723 RepID=A0A182MU50_9DIPT
MRTSVSSAKSPDPVAVPGLAQACSEVCIEDGDDDSLHEVPGTDCNPFERTLGPLPPTDVCRVAPPFAIGLLLKSSLARVRGIHIGDRLGPVLTPPLTLPVPPPVTPPLTAVPIDSENSLEHRLLLSNVFLDWLPLAKFRQLRDSPVPVGAPEVALITPLFRSSHIVAPLPEIRPKSLPYWGDISLS